MEVARCNTVENHMVGPNDQSSKSFPLSFFLSFFLVGWKLQLQRGKSRFRVNDYDTRVVRARRKREWGKKMTDRSTECRNRWTFRPLWRRFERIFQRETTSKIKMCVRESDATGWWPQKKTYTRERGIFVFILPGQNYLTRLKIIESAEIRSFFDRASLVYLRFDNSLGIGGIFPIE